MKNRIPKIHMQDTDTPAEKYSKSPHISGAIKAGNFTKCRIISDNLDSPLYPVTCKACMNVLMGLTREGAPMENINE